MEIGIISALYHHIVIQEIIMPSLHTLAPVQPRRNVSQGTKYLRLVQKESEFWIVC